MLRVYDGTYMLKALPAIETICLQIERVTQEEAKAMAKRAILCYVADPVVAAEIEVAAITEEPGTVFTMTPREGHLVVDGDYYYRVSYTLK